MELPPRDLGSHSLRIGASHSCIEFLKNRHDPPTPTVVSIWKGAVSSLGVLKPWAGFSGEKPMLDWEFWRQQHPLLHGINHLPASDLRFIPCPGMRARGRGESGGQWSRGVPQHPSPSWMHPTIPAPLGPFLRRVGPRTGLGRRPSASRRRRRRRRGGERPCRSFARCGKGEKGGRLSRCFPNLGGTPFPGPQPGQEWPGCHHSPQWNGTTLGRPQKPRSGFGGVGGCRWRPPRSRPPPIPHCSRLGGRRRSRAKGQREGRREGGRRDVLEPPVMLVELLFQAACVSLFLSSGQGRVYPARKKPASFAVER